MNMATLAHNDMTLIISNIKETVMMVRVEPWADEFWVNPGRNSSLFTGPMGGILELEVTDSALTIYGWAGSTFSVVDSVGA